MAAFSHNQQQQQHGLDSLFLPAAVTDFLHHHDQNQNAFFLSHHQFYQLPPSSSSSHHHLSFHDQGIPAAPVSDPLITILNCEKSEQTMNKQSADSLSSLDDYKAESAAITTVVGDYFTQNSVASATSMAKKRKISDGSSSSLSSAHSKVLRENLKSKKQKKGSNGDEKGKKEDPSKVGYIHVRARRGQATDSHSLAERIRREKISEKMKQLQALVPGCDKVTGKALMLDEIINYLQSLQHQVEFLSMKLSSFNPMFYDFGTDLDAFMLVPQPNEGMSSFMSNVQHCKNPTFIGDSTSTSTSTFTIPNNNFPLLDPSSSRLFQQQMPTALPQENGGQVLWDIDEQRQRLIGMSGFMANNNNNNNNNLGSFH